VSGPFGTRINVRDGAPPPNGSSATDRVLYYGVQSYWTLVGAGLLLVGVTAGSYLLLKDVEFLQPRSSAWVLIRKSLQLCNQHRAFLRIAGRVPESPKEIAEASGQAHGHALAQKYRRTRTRDNVERIEFEFSVELPATEVGVGVVCVDARKSASEFEIYNLVVLLPRLKKKIVIVKGGTMTADTHERKRVL
jgi:hypothetical protein